MNIVLIVSVLLIVLILLVLVIGEIFNQFKTSETKEIREKKTNFNNFPSNSDMFDSNQSWKGINQQPNGNMFDSSQSWQGMSWHTNEDTSNFNQLWEAVTKNRNGDMFDFNKLQGMNQSNFANRGRPGLTTLWGDDLSGFDYNQVMLTNQLQQVIAAVMKRDKDAANKITVLAERLQAAQNESEQKKIAREIQDIVSRVNEEAHAKSLKDGILSQEILDIATYGEEAMATVLESYFTKRYKGETAEVNLKLKVMPPSGSPYVVEVTKHIFPDSFFSIEPGNSLIVYYMPDNPKKLAIAFPIR